MVTYQFGKQYIDTHVIPKGTFFIEEHKFPHYATASKPHGTLRMTLARKAKDAEGNDGFKLTTFELDYSEIIVLEENCIHTDTLSSGPIAISISADMEAAEPNTVFL